MDGLATFVREFPVWTKDGEPLSWRHYVYGMAQIRRAAARESLRMAGAMRMGQAADEHKYGEWRRELAKESI